MNSILCLAVSHHCINLLLLWLSVKHQNTGALRRRYGGVV